MTTPSKPPASIVIPTWDGLADLTRCLEALACQTRRDAEIVVVDNGSSDGTAEFVETHYPAVRLLQRPTNEGFVGGCNHGARAATGRWVIFLNNDAVAAPTWYEQFLLALEGDPRWGGCTSKILTQTDHKRYDALGSYLTPCGFLRHVGLLEEDRGQYDDVRAIFSTKGVAFAVRRDLFEKLGGFDDAYFAYYEESDLCWQLWLLGYRVGFAPRALVYHRVGATGRRLGYATVDYHSFKNRLRTILKLGGPMTLGWMLPLHLLCCAGLVLANGLRPYRWPNAWAIVRAIGWNAAVWRETLRRRRTIQRTRRVSDRTLFREVMRPVPLWEFLRYTWWMVVARERMRARWQNPPCTC